MTFSQHNLPLLGLFCLTLVSCSGGADDPDSSRANILANAGSDKTVNEMSTISLSAQASGQTEDFTFTWRSTPTLDIIHANTSNAVATAIAPETTEELIYTFTVEVVDGVGNRTTDQVFVTVIPVNESPIIVLQVPQFIGLDKNEFPAGELITLDASGSEDPDVAANSAPIKEYSWQQIAGESVLNGVTTQSDKLSFITPILNDSNTVSLRVTVTDQEGATSTEDVELSIQSDSDTLPKVDAGLNHEVFSGESILLSGEASTNISASRPLTALWLNDSDRFPVIDDVQALRTVAIAPAVSQTENVTFTLRVRDAQGNEVEDSLTVAVKPFPIRPINDTGVSQQANNSQVSNQHQSDFPGQDGQRGLDIVHVNNLSAKAGRGDIGFDFTKLDTEGDEVDDPTQAWSCVRDNVTGLIWEVKTGPGTTGLHSNIHTFTWFKEEDNGGFTGHVNGAGSSCSIADCSTAAYLVEVNTQGLCNFKDWRVPSKEELLSIVHFGRLTAPAVDPTYFPNATTGLTAPAWYWTDDSSADGISDIGAQNAWSIDFFTANDNFLDKSTPVRIRLVRAGR